MADNKQDQSPKSSSESGGAFIKRELNGATFLTLEHTLHMALVVIVPALLAVGIVAAIKMWTDGGQTASDVSVLVGGMLGSGIEYLTALGSISIVAALLVLVPSMILVERRTRAEWLKRPGYTSRLAYKAPVYTAIGILVVLIALAKIAILAVIIKSLVFIGVENADVGAMYRDEFMPALIGLILFTGAGWYAFRLAKGRDYGRTFSSLTTLLTAVVVVALLITSATVIQDTSVNQPLLPQEGFDTPSQEFYEEQQLPNFEEYFNQ